ncbi:MAG: YdjY domain-containing protein [Kiritimatiellae bacterium]|nr:YdjY domain-containing protein [Kiritimatiellia bacterium]MDD4340721.1 YdjY domain-containing protein [Kiritimatiellia bacterium]MDY0149737.1 YdjY domain-containing protein [Kiritimatiellia bacterium]
MSRRTICFFALGLTLTLATTAPAAEHEEPIVIYPAGSEPQPPPSPVCWDGPIAHLGEVRVHSATKTVTATGWVNQTHGAIELLACGPKGKVHECVFVLSVNPIDLQAALLLAGLKGGEPMPDLGKGPPTGSPVDIFVEWDADGDLRRERAETFIWQIKEDAVLPNAPWIFNGSMVKEGRFMGFAEESLVATYWDPYALININHPAGANDEALHANPRQVPPYGTPITMHFIPR